MTTKMNPEAKAKIVAALRSGKYKQAIGLLHPQPNCFCIWGVIADLANPTGWELEGNEYTMYGHVACPPNIAEQWAGIKWSQDRVTINGQLLGLSDHNDYGATFDQLADAIEEQL